MSTSKETFIQRVRQAVQKGNQPGYPTEIQQRGNIGYQGAGADPVARFCDALKAAGGQSYLVGNEAEATQKVRELVLEKSPKKVLLGRGKYLDRLPLEASLPGEGIVVQSTDGITIENHSELFDAEIGISGVKYLIAETGSLVVASAPEDPRSVSLLPPIQIAVASREQLLPDLFDLFTRYSPETSMLPSGLVIITGPSKTGDIELRLVTGVHGPGEVHVVLLASNS